MKRIISIIIVLFTSVGLYAQDVNCRVQVLLPQVQNADKQIYTEMEKAIYEFINNTKWTNDVIQINERIEFNLIINIKEQIGIDEFKATAQIQSTRPVYNSSYNSTLFNYMDEDWQFKYILNQPLEFNENEFRSNLTSLLAYYTYIVIGLDYDSFSLLGGTPYYQKARMIVNNAQASGGRGWKAFDGTRNRFILIDNLLDNSFKPIRESYYSYHRLGMDLMSQNIENGREEIKALLPNIQKVAKDKPNSMLINVFFSSKNEELINLFSGLPANEKQAIIQMLSEMDPGNSNKYQQISRNN